MHCQCNIPNVFYEYTCRIDKSLKFTSYGEDKDSFTEKGIETLRPYCRLAALVDKKTRKEFRILSSVWISQASLIPAID